jgi:Domain of unknown function (DUF4389)
VRTGFVPELENRNKLTVGFRIILVIPQVIVLGVLVAAALVALVIAVFAVLLTGRWPEGLRRFVVGVMRWGTRVTAYFLLLTEVPPVQPRVIAQATAVSARRPVTALVGIRPMISDIEDVHSSRSRGSVTGGRVGTVVPACRALRARRRGARPRYRPSRTRTSAPSS